LRQTLARLATTAERLLGARLWALTTMVFRFGVSGGLGAAVFMAVFYGLTEWAHVFYLYSSLAAWLVAFCVSFLMQQRWTFGGEAPPARRQLYLYGALFLANMALNEVLLYLLVDRLQVPRQLAQLSLLVMISIWNFFIMRFFIFRPAPQTDAS
jgi:putative flippase GtrA